MSVYVDSSSRLHHDQERSLALSCPHCQVCSHITAVSIPQYSELVASRPNHVGIVYPVSYTHLTLPTIYSV